MRTLDIISVVGLLLLVSTLQAAEEESLDQFKATAAARARHADMDSNIYFSVADRNPGKVLLKKQKAAGIDANSLAVDPHFVDPAKGDFRLMPGSPALKPGIVPIDLSKVGLQDTPPTQ
jgi:hypothetical protein